MPTAKYRRKFTAVGVTRTTRKTLSAIARGENRSLQGQIEELCQFWIKLHCPECGQEVLSGTCPCKKPGV